MLLPVPLPCSARAQAFRVYYVFVPCEKHFLCPSLVASTIDAPGASFAASRAATTAGHSDDASSAFSASTSAERLLYMARSFAKLLRARSVAHPDQGIGAHWRRVAPVSAWPFSLRAQNMFAAYQVFHRAPTEPKRSAASPVVIPIHAKNHHGAVKPAPCLVHTAERDEIQSGGDFLVFDELQH
jgi:hypothetical protein